MKPETDNAHAFRSGFVSLTGRPNVGKSTFLNAVLGEKVSIVTPKAQTTRNRIVGIKNLADAQVVFLDTPGIHRPLHKLGTRMVNEAIRAVKEVDVVLFMVEPMPAGVEETRVIGILRKLDKPVLLLINKADTVRKPDLLPVMEEYGGLYAFREIIPVSAIKGEGLGLVVEKVVGLLPPGPKYYPDGMVTDMYERFMAAELVREKVIMLTGEEVPHSSAVEVTAWEERPGGGLYIGANIYIEKEGQKGIIIGKSGRKLKEIGSQARTEIERLLGTGVYLDLRVKVKKRWRTDESALKELGL